jgi:hypothetical protein
MLLIHEIINKSKELEKWLSQIRRQFHMMP